MNKESGIVKDAQAPPRGLTGRYWDIHMGYARERAMTRTTLFQSNRSQAVRLPKDVAFPEGVRQVSVRREGARRVIAPADGSWDDFFDAPGADIPERSQREVQDRDPF